MPEQRKGGKKSKSKDDRPARARYWAKRTLEVHKVKRLRGDRLLWISQRQGRVPDGWLHKS